MVRQLSGLRKRSDRGFTLIELIVVLVILAAVAGIVIPAVAMLGRSTDMAASASNQRELASQMQEFFLLQKRYPQGMDSLLVATTSTPTPSALYLPIYSTGTSNPEYQIGGMTASNPGLVNNLTMVQLTGVASIGSNLFRSMTRGGIDYVYDHDVTETNSNNSGKFRREVVDQATGNGINANSYFATITQGATSTAVTNNSGLHVTLRGLVPSELTPNGSNWSWTPENNTRIVALGIGPNCRLVPVTSMMSPTYPGADGKYYGRYIAFFKVFGDTGERAVLLGVTDAYGRTMDYTQQQFNESLPNGSRQG